MKAWRPAVVFCLAVIPFVAGHAVMAGDGAAGLTQTTAPRIFMIEATSGTVLLSRSADEPVQPGSMAKLMTVETILDSISRGETNADVAFPVSEHAWRTGGAPSRTTTMFAALKSSVPLRDLLNGIIVQNANDGCIIAAEGLSGSEDAFTQRMNERARALGLSGSRFGNSTGLPPGESVVTMRDMVSLARHIQSSYPEYFALYAQPDYEWNRIRQRNKNPLIGRVEGIDGFAAGYADGAGFGLIATAARGQTRLFLAMSGLPTEKERQDEAERLLEWGFSDFALLKVFAAGAEVGRAQVYGGASETVPLSTHDEVLVYAPKADLAKLAAEVDYKGPIKAPVANASEVGQLKVKVGNAVLKDVPVFTSADIDQGSVSSRAKDALRALLFFWL